MRSSRLLYLLLLPLVSTAQAAGLLKLESDGFLRYSEQRPNATQTLSIGPKTQSESKYISSEVDVQANVQMADSSTFTPEATNLYVATSPNISQRHQVTLGRRTESWSQMDDQWEAGIYSPRFIWDPTRPQKVGLTGAMYQYRSRNVVGTLFGTGIDIPERGFPIREESGRLTSSNPFYVPLYEYAEYQGQLIPIRYHIHYPPLNDLVVNPGAVAKVRIQESNDRGLWAQVSGGYLPIHQPSISIEDSGLYNAAANRVDVQVHPSIDYHRLLTLESGLKARRFSVWGSVSRETPEKTDTTPGRISAQMENALIGAVGGEAKINRRTTLSASFLHVHEDPAPIREDEVIKVELPGRFTYKRAIRSRLAIEGNGRMSYGARWIYDLVDESHLASADTFIRLSKQSRNLTLNLGADFFISSTGTGSLGQFKGDDRVRGGVSYAF